MPPKPTPPTPPVSPQTTADATNSTPKSAKSAMSTRQATLQKRDQALRRDYLRLRALTAKEGRKPRPKHSVAEILKKLAKKYHLSVRRVEDIVWKRRV